MDENIMACTLTAGDLRERMAWIAGLNSRSLRASHREGLTLTLDYDRAAISELRKMVAGEQACCAFLNFEIVEQADFVRVSIVAPEEARDAAEALFEPFASSMISNAAAAACGCASGCGA